MSVVMSNYYGATAEQIPRAAALSDNPVKHNISLFSKIQMSNN